MRENNMIIEFDSRSENEGFARVAVAAFVTPLNPTLEEIEDVKTAVSEAVTNSVIHGYGERVEKIILKASIKENTVSIEITDFGCGIENIEKAMEPMYTTRPDLERSGMGFSFMDLNEVESNSSCFSGVVHGFFIVSPLQTFEVSFRLLYHFFILFSITLYCYFALFAFIYAKNKMHRASNFLPFYLRMCFFCCTFVRFFACTAYSHEKKA